MLANVLIEGRCVGVEVSMHFAAILYIPRWLNKKDDLKSIYCAISQPLNCVISASTTHTQSHPSVPSIPPPPLPSPTRRGPSILPVRRDGGRERGESQMGPTPLDAVIQARGARGQPFTGPGLLGRDSPGAHSCLPLPTTAYRCHPTPEQLRGRPDVF